MLDAIPNNGRTKEPQYELLIESEREHGRTTLGLMTNQVFNDDPKRLLFTLSRYKFVAKMLQGRKRVLEVGCGDAFATRIVQQAVGKVTATDFDPTFVEDAKKRVNSKWPLEIVEHDFLEGPIPGSFDAVYLLDVLEHIPEEKEAIFLQNVSDSLDPADSVAIFGMPSLESQEYASIQSKLGHVNCKSANEFKRSLEQYYNYVFIFSMNDEVIHTGFAGMSHYLFAVCCAPRGSSEHS